jgi:glycosyltransferase involved in cell wall biosynthesis
MVKAAIMNSGKEQHAKRILVVSTNDSLSGAPLYVKSVVEGLSNTFTFLAVFGEKGPVGDYLINHSIPVHIIQQIKSSINPFYDLISIYKLFWLIRKFNPDIIYAHSSKAGMLARLITLFTGIPTVYTVHGWGWRGMGIIKKKLIIAIEKLLLYIPNSYFIYVAEAVKAEGLSTLKIKENRGQVILNGTRDIFLGNATHQDGEIKLMMVARIAAAKDHETLIRAFELTGSNAELWLCGEGTDSLHFIQLATMWAPTYYSKIKFLGDNLNVDELLSKIDIFLLISNYEALPLSIIEAMSAGKAIIATNIGGIPELITHGINGMLVERGDVMGLSATILKFKNKENRYFCGVRAREVYLKKFMVNNMLDDIKNSLLSIFI